MPVDDHAVHPMTKIGADYRYGCHNKPRPVVGDRVVSYFSGEFWKYAFSTECKYDYSTEDAKCSGCRHILKKSVTESST